MLNSEGSEFEKVIDYYICSESDVLIPSISGLFYPSVAGKRIAYGRTHILVPAIIESRPTAATDYLPSYVWKKTIWPACAFAESKAREIVETYRSGFLILIHLDQWQVEVEKPEIISTLSVSLPRVEYI